MWVNLNDYRVNKTIITLHAVHLDTVHLQKFITKYLANLMESFEFHLPSQEQETHYFHNKFITS